MGMVLFALGYAGTDGQSSRGNDTVVVAANHAHHGSCPRGREGGVLY